MGDSASFSGDCGFFKSQVCPVCSGKPNAPKNHRKFQLVPGSLADLPAFPASFRSIHSAGRCGHWKSQSQLDRKNIALQCGALMLSHTVGSWLAVGIIIIQYCSYFLVGLMRLQSIWSNGVAGRHRLVLGLTKKIALTIKKSHSKYKLN